MIIDPPSPFAPLAEWLAYREELRTYPPGDPDVMAAIADADTVIQEKRNPAV